MSGHTWYLNKKIIKQITAEKSVVCSAILVLVIDPTRSTLLHVQGTFERSKSSLFLFVNINDSYYHYQSIILLKD